VNIILNCAISDDHESVEDVQRPFSADIFERHVQQVIEEDFPESQNAKAPAVQIISSKLNQVMNREVTTTTKNTPEAVPAPYEVTFSPTIDFYFRPHYLFTLK
jgi:hypothetical protein